MKTYRIFGIVATSLSVAALAGCSGSSAPTSSPTPTEQTFGPLTTRIVGTATPPVTSSAAYGANVTGIAGALVDRLTLNAQGTPTLSDTKIAFTSDRDVNLEIYTMNADGTGQTNISNNAASDSAPFWSFDNSKIAFTSFRDGNYEVYAMNADGTGQTRLTNNPASDQLGCYSPDGSKIAFTSDRDGNNEIYLMNADGTGQTRLTNNAAIDEVPAFSPDGSKIAFYSDRDGSGTEIYMMNVDGTGQTRLTNNAANDFNPAWSPDSSRIAFNSFRDGNFEIYVMNADGTNQTRLTNNAAFEFAPSFSPDGSQILFGSGRDGNNEIYSMGAFGGPAVNLTKKPSVYDVPNSKSWSGYLPRTPKTLVGAGGTLGATAAGFLFGLKDILITSVVAFDTTTAGSRAAARIVNQTATETQGNNLVFSITTSVGLASVSYAPITAAGVPGTAVSPSIPNGSTGALVAFSASQGTVVAVLPYAANRSVPAKKVSGASATYTGSFTAVFDASGKNLAPGGAKSVTLDEKTGKLVSFE